ncbi:MAG: pentapeptide repeat-containing protein, partial [Chloroflexi bacterium]|nr:pentapeptide repeat-containing protein [Chloroflexota bacterium]
MATCTYQTPFGYRCPLEEADATGLCILHTKNESKDGTAFMEALRGKIRHDVEDTAAQEVRLDGVVFPGPLVWVEVVRGLPTIAKPISFQGAAFSGAANFWGATFTGAADFTGATFTGAADFSSATFTGAANFSWAAFTRDAGFWEATFKGRTLFQHTVFPTEEAKGSVDFQEIAIEKPEEFFFEDVALSRVPFLRTNLARVQLTDITWARKPERFTPWVRHNVVYDHLEMEQEEKSHKEQG